MDRDYEAFGETDLTPMEPDRPGRAPAGVRGALRRGGARGAGHVRTHASSYALALGLLAVGAGAYLLARGLRRRGSSRPAARGLVAKRGAAGPVLTPEDRPPTAGTVLDASGRPVEDDR